jgi:peptidoglycan/LPS O-acetylase OafA/YrhL
MQHRPDIDGLRAAAVIPVLLYHADVAPFSGGYVGVDIFFVISGYLITSLILEDQSAGRFSILGFYERRMRRIFPALFTVLIFCLGVGFLLFMPADFRRLGATVAATTLFSSNLLFVHQGGYFDSGADLKPLLHTWSLAVEEQYYIVFPLFMAAMLVFAKRTLFNTVVVVAGVSFIWSLVQLAYDPIGAFYLPFGRAWELLLGAMLAMRAQSAAGPRWLAEVLAVLGLGAILWSVVTYPADASFPGVKALVPCVGAALVIGSGIDHKTMVARLLSLHIPVFVGVISYSLYLWHLPLIVVSKYYLMRALTGPETVLVLLCAVALAVLSWRYIETPFRRRPPRINARPMFAAATAVMAACFSAGALIYVLNGLPQRLPAEVSTLAMGAIDNTFSNSFCNTIDQKEIAAGQACNVGYRTAEMAPSFAIFGDSIGSSLLPAIETAATEHGRTGVALTHGGCYPLVGISQSSDPPEHRTACRAFVDASVDYIHSHPSIASVIVVGRWTSAAEGSRFGATMVSDWYITDDQSPSASYAENKNVFIRGMTRAVNALAGRRVFVVTAVPEQKVDVPRTAALARYLGRDVRVDLDRKDFDARQHFVSAALADLSRHLGFVILDLGQSLCGERRCAATRDGRSLYADDNHLSRDGALLTTSIFDAVFKTK